MEFFSDLTTSFILPKRFFAVVELGKTFFLFLLAPEPVDDYS